MSNRETSTSKEDSDISGLITRARLLELFDRLNEKLNQADQQGDLRIVGRTMIALAHDAKRVTGGRHDLAELVLRRLEARMAESGLRALIYLTQRTVVEFATRPQRTDRPLERNVRPEPVTRVLAELLRPETQPQSWLTRLHAVLAGRSRVPAPTLWNSPTLVVTGAMASRTLCAALEHERAYPVETIDCLMQEVDVDEVAVMFEAVTGKLLRSRTAR